MPVRPSRRTRRRARVVTTDVTRFAAGWRLVDLTPDVGAIAGPALPDVPTVHLDVIRARDLVALSVDAVRCEIVAGGAAPAHLRPIDGEDGHLVVRYAFQHLGEQAVYEEPAPVAPERPDSGPPVQSDPTGADAAAVVPVPAGALPARSSRLVFAVAADETIELSTNGVLAAMGRLPLVVHKLALPGDEPTRASLGLAPGLVLPGGLVLHLTADGPILARAERTASSPDVATVDGLALQSRALRAARGHLATEAGVPLARARLGDLGVEAAANVTVAGEVIDVPPLLGPGGLVIGPPIGRPRRPRPSLSSPPGALETSIEAPFRLVISPSVEARWAHAEEPVPADDEPRHVELWHSRLGTAKEEPDGTISVDERDSRRRTIRALWARDRERSADDWTDPKKNLGHGDDPFRMSLSPADRHMLVRQTSETWLDGRRNPIAPVPVGAKALWLSALGAWLDLHGGWTTKPYSSAQMSSILEWDHVAPLGRDQYVRVVYPGYLYPFGHQCALVKVTERKMKQTSPSVAGLYQRKFLVLGERRRIYGDRLDLPMSEVSIRPLVTPTIDDPETDAFPGQGQDTFFWPAIGGQRFRFIVEGFDHAHQPVRLPMPLMWVPEHNHQFAVVDQAYDDDADRKVVAFGQKLAYGKVHKGGDTVVETESISFRGKASLGDSRPHMSQARVVLPAVQQLSAIGSVPIAYDDDYRSGGFDDPANAGEVWAKVLTDPSLREHPTDDVIALPQMTFGAGAPSGSDKAGGFLSPDQPIRALSRAKGTVGDPAGTKSLDFDPTEALKGALPKLFGLIPLVELIEAVTGEPLKLPAVASEALDRVEGLMNDLERAKRLAADAVSEAGKLVDRAAQKTAELQADAQDALDAANDVAAAVAPVVDDFVALIGSLTLADEATVSAQVNAVLGGLNAAIGDLKAAGPKLPPLARNEIAKVTGVLQQVLDAADLIEDIHRFVNGFDPSSIEARFRFEWRPEVAPWFFPGITDEPTLDLKPDSLVLAVDGRASGKDGMGVEVLAEIRDFALNLLPGAPMVRIRFDHLSFKAGTAGKAEVDVVMGEIEFVGYLSFVEDIKDLIPFDGFSDPPFLDVTPAGLSAGFTLALPSLSIGVFTLANMSLGADVQVPFLGKSVTVGFNFCTRERPFTLTVMFLGGGGWFGLRISPEGLDVLELGLEAGACLAIDLGVASGSISAMIGVYLRLEGDDGSLTGYFRLRGEVDVLGLISASIELYLELRYDFPTGKMHGKATITVEVKVLVFSGSVKISAERRFAGSNGDPTFLQVMGAETGTSSAWTEYCLAFAGA